MLSLGRLKLLGHALRTRGVHPHGLATVGAMLTCVAVILNVGPFTRAPKIDGLPGALRQTAQPITEQPVGSGLTLRPDIDASIQPDRPQSSMNAADAAEPLRPRTELSSISVVEIAPSASQPSTPKDGDGEIRSNLTQEDFGAADPAAQTPGNPANADLTKRAMFVGVWAPDAGTCSARNFREGVLPAVINADGAWAGETFCVFKNKHQTETGWKVIAKCSNPRERWTTSVRLTVYGNRLTWTSKRGTQAYTRCASDVLMAEAR